MHFLEGLVGEEADACVGHHAQDGGGEASVQRLQPLLPGDPSEHVHDVTVPVREPARPRTDVSLSGYRRRSRVQGRTRRL